MQTIRNVRAAMAADAGMANAALIGFAGSPWTVATYMIEGKGGTDHEKIRALAWREPQTFERLMDVLVDATSGQQLSPLSSGMIRQLARSYYAGGGQLSAVQLLEHDVPMEVRGRSAPLWRADFDDWLETTLYLHPDTGALVARRHRLWRWYDFLWMLHIMDYGEREAATGVVPRVATVLGAITIASGVWLLYFSFWRPRTVRR